VKKPPLRGIRKGVRCWLLPLFTPLSLSCPPLPRKDFFLMFFLLLFFFWPTGRALFFFFSFFFFFFFFFRRMLNSFQGLPPFFPPTLPQLIFLRAFLDSFSPGDPTARNPGQKKRSGSYSPPPHPLPLPTEPHCLPFHVVPPKILGGPSQTGRLFTSVSACVFCNVVFPGTFLNSF